MPALYFLLGSHKTTDMVINMNYSFPVKAKVVAIQLVTAVLYSSFVYAQTILIDRLGSGTIRYKLFLIPVVLLILYIAASLAEQFIRERIYMRYAARVKKDAARAFLYRDPQAHTALSDEQHVSFFSNEIVTVNLQYLYLSLYRSKQLIMFCLSLLTLVFIAWQCGVAIFLAAFCFSGVIRAFGTRLADRQQELQVSKDVFAEKLMTLYQGYEELHVNQMERIAEREFNDANGTVERDLYRCRMSALGAESLSVGQNMMIYILVMLVGGWLAMQGAVGVGLFVMAAELSVQALNEWSSITRMNIRIKGVQRLKKQVEDYIYATNKPLKELSSAKGDSLVELRDAAFQYGSTVVWKGVNLTIRRGKKYLITGESGSGKSTLLEVLTGYKTLAKGSVSYFSDNVACILQEPFLFSGTLRENLVFDREDIDEGRIAALLAKLGLDLPLDYAIENEGKNLSGGQKARVALIRAILAGPELLIADEITANLDQDLGKRVEQMLLEDFPEISLCHVAHRTYYREGYDVVFRVENHSIREVCNEN